MSHPSVQPVSGAELRELSRDPAAVSLFSPLAGRCFLLVDTGSVKPTDAAGLARWLRQLPCPVLGIIRPRTPRALRDACDIVLRSASEAALLAANIERVPMAATVLVQLLRATERLPVAEALTAESLAYATLQAGAEFRRWLAEHRPAAPPEREPGAAVVLQRAGSELVLELNRPSNRNAMSVEMRDALMEALQLVLADRGIRSVEIRGRGKCFSTGGDLSEFGTVPDSATGHIVRSLALPGRLLAQCARRVRVRVHGACVGSGIEFPAFAGRISAAEDAWFQLPELQMGLIPGAGGCVSIARRIGRQRTAWLVLSGKRIKAQQALEWGLVDAVAKA